MTRTRFMALLAGLVILGIVVIGGYVVYKNQPKADVSSSGLIFEDLTSKFGTFTTAKAIGWNGDYWLIAGVYKPPNGNVAEYSVFAAKYKDGIVTSLSDGIPQSRKMGWEPEDLTWNGKEWLIVSRKRFLDKDTLIALKFDGTKFTDVTPENLKVGDGTDSPVSVGGGNNEWLIGGGTTKPYLYRYDGVSFTDLRGSFVGTMKLECGIDSGPNRPCRMEDMVWTGEKWVLGWRRKFLADSDSVGNIISKGVFNESFWGPPIFKYDSINKWFAGISGGRIGVLETTNVEKYAITSKLLPPSGGFYNPYNKSTFEFAADIATNYRPLDNADLKVLLPGGNYVTQFFELGFIDSRRKLIPITIELYQQTGVRAQDVKINTDVYDNDIKVDRDDFGWLIAAGNKIFRASDPGRLLMAIGNKFEIAKSDEITLFEHNNDPASHPDVTVKWAGKDLTNCLSSWGGSDRYPATGSRDFPLLNLITTFTLTCDSAQGKVSNSVKGKLLPTINAQIRRKVENNWVEEVKVQKGEDVVLRFAAEHTNAGTPCTSSWGGSDRFPANYEREFQNVTQSLTLRVTCEGPGGSRSQSVEATLAQ